MRVSRRKLLWSGAAVVLTATGHRLARGFNERLRDIAQIPPSLRKAVLDLPEQIYTRGSPELPPAAPTC